MTAAARSNPEDNASEEYVASTTLTEPTWSNTTVIGGDLVDAVRTLKAAGDGDLLLHGYGPVAKELHRNGLLDELYLWVHPVLAGVGSIDDTLLDDGLHSILTPLDVRRLDSGVVILHYSTQQP
jgi:dihydrofolate reductase